MEGEYQRSACATARRTERGEGAGGKNAKEEGNNLKAMDLECIREKGESVGSVGGVFKHSASKLSVPFISLSTAQAGEAQLSTGRKSCPQPQSSAGKEISLG